ncbi:PREDICTED: follistatin-related protein 1-like [Priapulus caudatus]|uniref:Follistatin-related protein 1 n=1 Tax=Priapulus caudatus TaxID=37621 RepID=A0ABM1EJP6_PRICU|nr:PREDICTED: follistatin-related protein 1-like [Priapulus caudatus]
MELKLVVVLAALVLVSSAAVDKDEKAKLCETVDCGRDRECDVIASHVTCVCLKFCPDHEKKVCGSNKNTYQNHCELHRDACLSGEKISIEYDGECVPDNTDKAKQLDEKLKAKPIVCFQHERDALRQSLISWFQAHTDGTGRKAYREVLKHVFKTCDEDKNQRLDSTELLLCVAKNRTSEQQKGSSTDILRGLCVDALIDLADADIDWRLDLQEFKKLMNQNFTPSVKKCSLEGSEYDDGAETTVECNKCVCACGNWVCTAIACDSKNTETKEAPTVVQVKTHEPKVLDSDEEVDIFLNDFKGPEDKLEVESVYGHVTGSKRKHGKKHHRRRQ